MYRRVGVKSRRRVPMNRGFSAFGGASERRPALSPTSSIGLGLAAERGLARRRQLLGIVRHALANAAAATRHGRAQPLVIFETDIAHGAAPVLAPRRNGRAKCDQYNERKRSQ